MPELLPYKPGVYLWKYVPNTPLSVVGAILWFFATAPLAWRMYKTRTWFCSAFAVGCAMEVIGYCARAGAANKTNDLMLDIIQATFILLPPALFAATIYMCLSRIIICVGGEYLSIVKPRWLTMIFVGGDVVSIGIQGGAANPDLGDIGKWMIVTGLFIQFISFGLFGLSALIFHARIRKTPTARSCQVDQSWINTMFMLYGVSGLIIFRSAFRIVEFVMGKNGYPLMHEWTLYVFDTVPMLVVALLFYLWYPDKLARKEFADIQLESQVSADDILPATAKVR